MPEAKKEVTLDLSSLPKPNTEFVVYIVAQVVALIVVAIAKSIVIGSWWEFFMVTTAVYILSRGIAKAHNVSE